MKSFTWRGEYQYVYCKDWEEIASDWNCFMKRVSHFIGSFGYDLKIVEQLNGKIVEWDWFIKIWNTKINTVAYKWVELSSVIDWWVEFEYWEDFIDWLRKCVSIVKDKMQSVWLTWVNIRRKDWFITIAWTDTSRLHRYSIESEWDPFDVIVPWSDARKIIKEVRPWRCVVWNKRIIFKFDEWEIHCCLIDLKYVDYDKFFAWDWDVVSIDVDKLNEIIDKSLILWIGKIDIAWWYVKWKSDLWSIEEEFEWEVWSINPNYLKHAIQWLSWKVNVVTMWKFFKIEYNENEVHFLAIMS